jgi:CO/xanthine dehydrogenase Mo-binding subunit
MSLSRREFIRNVSLAGGALTLGVQLTGCSSEPLALAGPNDFAPDAFLRLSETGDIVLQVHKAEMGQGVSTGLVTLIAEELDVEPGDIRIEFAPVHDAFRDPDMYMQITGGSSSLRVHYPLFRRIGASARDVLLRAAAADSGLALADLTTEPGHVVSRDGAYRAPYVQLVPIARGLTVNAEVALKPESEFRLIGQYDKRIDAQAKSDGTARFGIDCRPPGCLSAVVARNPQFGGRVTVADDSAARQIAGVVDIFPIHSGIAVVAQGYWAARKAAGALKLDYHAPDNALPADSAAIEQVMSEALAGDDFRSVLSVAASGDAGGETVTAEYRLPFLAHAAMEPQNATAQVRDGECDVWVGSQAPDVARDAAARILDLPRRKVRVHNQLLGGGFGRRAAADNVAEAVAIAAQTSGRPVQLVWSREDDTRHDFYRPAFAGRLQAQVTAEGKISHWEHRIVGPSINQQVMPQLGKSMLPEWMPTGLLNVVGDYVASEDFASVEGADDLPYTIDGANVLYHNLETQVPLGYWRSVGHSHTAFVVETFVDELAAEAGIDPVAFRLRNLAPDSSHYRVLSAVAEAADWNLAKSDRYRGVALHASFHSTVAQVVEVSVTAGQPRVERVFCAIECGQVVNPDIVRDQMTGSILFGLTAALSGKITLVNGAVEQSNFHDYPVIRHNEAPEIEVVLVPSNAAPTGVGEPAVPPIAPALANAIFAASGQRRRELPLS